MGTRLNCPYAGSHVVISTGTQWINSIASVYKRHPVTKFEHSIHGVSKRRITVNDRIHRYTCVRKKILAPSSLASCATASPFSRTYLLAPLLTRVNDAYTRPQLRGNGRMGGGASEWHSFQSMRGRTRGVRRLRGQSRPIISK